jgi:hypothetical protein
MLWDGRSPVWLGRPLRGILGREIVSSDGRPKPGARTFAFSHILGRMAQLLSEDWDRIYGHPIHYLETFVDPGRFRGTCYRAANWKVLGLTTGRGKDAPTKKPNRSIKEVLGYPLTKDFRRLLQEVI